MKKIVAPIGTGVKVARALGCSTTQVSLAMNYRDDSLLSRKIRKVAVEQFGGIELEITGRVTPIAAGEVPTGT